MDDQPFGFPESPALTGEYARAPTLARRVRRMIAEVPDFAHLKGTRIVVVWKTGQSKKLGQCEKTKGPLVLFSGGATFIITVYLDMCRLFGFTERQMDALLDHELRHCGFNPEGQPEIVRHDIEEFLGTVRRYGLWFEDVQRFAQLVSQMGQQAEQ